MWCMELKIGMSDKHHRHSKHTKFCQNLRGSLQFFVDWENKQQWFISIIIMNHDSGFIIRIAMIFAKTLIECIPKSYLKKHPSA